MEVAFDKVTIWTITSNSENRKEWLNFHHFRVDYEIYTLKYFYLKEIFFKDNTKYLIVLCANKQVIINIDIPLSKQYLFAN